LRTCSKYCCTYACNATGTSSRLISPPACGVMRVALGVGRAQLLIAVLDFHGQLSGDIGRALADDLADLAHGRKLFGELHVFAAVLPANAAAGLLGGRLLPALAGLPDCALCAF
jgi:hypothetical protein